MKNESHEAGLGAWIANSFAEFSAWSPARKVFLAMLAIQFAHFSYLAVWELFQHDYPVWHVSEMRWLMWGWIGFNFFLIAICYQLIRISNTSRIPFYLMLFGYGGIYFITNYLYGVMDSVYSTSVVTLALIIMLLGSFKLVGIVIVYWMIITLALMAIQLMGWLPYAPMLADNSASAKNSLAWLGPAYFWVLEIILFTAFLLWIVWSSRDQALNALEQSRAQIRRYIPPAVADQIISGNQAAIDSPQRRLITVLFSDIVGFTNMADRVEPEAMTQVINEYMAAMSEIIEAHQGTLNEFIGDGIMALFGAPNALDSETQARQAILGAQAMQAKLPELNQQWLKLGIGEPLEIRIGINTGMASVGSYGSNGRMTYTAIGLQVNVAARIQSHCEPGGILLSDASWHLVKDQIDCEPKGEVECKGVHFPVKVYAAMEAET